MSLKQAIVRQFGYPTGLIGGLAGHIMARRTSNRIRNTKTVELMELRPDSRVLEVGCGPGLALLQTARLVSAGEVVGIDHSQVMIRQAVERIKRAGLVNRVALLERGCDALVEWPNHFDRIYSLNVIQFLPDRSAYVRDAFRALSKGGRLLTTYQPRLDNDRPDGAQAMAAELCDLMQETGFKDVHQVPIYAGERPAICVIGTRD